MDEEEKPTSTKVYYHLDDSTPYMSQIPVAPEKITLGDFKRVFKRRGYTYFCKQYDADLRKEVKVELISEVQRLPRSPLNGLVELFLLSHNNLPAGGQQHPPFSHPASHTAPSTSTLPRRPLMGGLVDMEQQQRGGTLTKQQSAASKGGSSTLLRKMRFPPRRSGSYGSLSAIASLTFAAAANKRDPLVATTTTRSASGEASSDLNTLISKRAGERMASDIYTGPSEVSAALPQRDENIGGTTHRVNGELMTTRMTTSAATLPRARNMKIEETFDNTLHATTLNTTATTAATSTACGASVRRRKPRRKNRHYRRPYVPSVISSGASAASLESGSFSLPRVEEHVVDLKVYPRLGISVACQDGGVFISRLEEGSAAEKCGGLEVGDQIVQVGHTSFEQLTDRQAVDLLRKVAASRRPTTVYVAKAPRHHGSHGSSASSSLGALLDSNGLDTTQKMDLSLWVEQTSRAEPPRPFHDIETPGGKKNNNKVANLVKRRDGSECGAVDSDMNPSGVNGVKSTGNEEQDASTEKEMSEAEETSEEEWAAYEDRRNGLGPRLVPALAARKRQMKQQKQPGEQRIIAQQNHFPTTRGMPPPPPPAPIPPTPVIPTMYNLVEKPWGGELKNCDVVTNGTITTRNRSDNNRRIVHPLSSPANTTTDADEEGEEVTGAEDDENGLDAYFGDSTSTGALDIGMDPTVILRRMCRRDSGLEIKDRRWLKIPVPMSFIGDEMLHWLLANVKGFRSRKAAKAYASILLSAGLIRHIVQLRGGFNEKCYYVFDEAIIADRLREDAELAERQRRIAAANAAAASKKGSKLGSTSANNNATLSSGAMSVPGVGGTVESNNTEITYMTTAEGGGGVGAAMQGGNNTLVPLAIGEVPVNGASGRIKIINNQKYQSGPIRSMASVPLSTGKPAGSGTLTQHHQSSNPPPPLLVKPYSGENNLAPMAGKQYHHAHFPPVSVGGKFPQFPPVPSVPNCMVNIDFIDNTAAFINSGGGGSGAAKTQLREQPCCESPTVTNDYASMVLTSASPTLAGSEAAPLVSAVGAATAENGGNNNILAARMMSTKHGVMESNCPSWGLQLEVAATCTTAGLLPPVPPPRTMPRLPPPTSHQPPSAVPPPYNP